MTFIIFKIKIRCFLEFFFLEKNSYDNFKKIANRISKTLSFSSGLPKIHKHDGKRQQAFGIFIDNRLVLLYTFKCDLGDGWEDPEVHSDPIGVREKALKMGANIMNYLFKN